MGGKSTMLWVIVAVLVIFVMQQKRAHADEQLTGTRAPSPADRRPPPGVQRLPVIEPPPPPPPPKPGAHANRQSAADRATLDRIAHGSVLLQAMQGPGHF